MESIKILWENIPTELKDVPQWVCWRYQKTQKGTTKIPINPKTGNKADSTDPSTWSPFPIARDDSICSNRTRGVGFVVTNNDDFFGIDIDHSIKDGKWSKEIQEIIDEFPTYTEITPSGEGLRILGKGKKQGDRCRYKSDSLEIEIYDQKRFFTVTGNRIGEQACVTPCQDPLNELYSRIFGQQSKTPKVSTSKSSTSSDSELIEKIRRSKQGAKFNKLWTGDSSDYPSQSEADMALCNILAFWTGNDQFRIDSLFRQSGLYDEKWEREDYRSRTIEKAITITKETYDPTTSSAHSNMVPENPVNSTEKPDKPKSVSIEETEINGDLEIETKPKTREGVPFSIDKLIPEKSFLDEYIQYSMPMCDAPTQFHLFTGISCLSAALGNQVAIPYGIGYIFPNLWIALIAPSSVYRKTSAIRIGSNLLAQIDPHIVLPDEFSNEMLLQTLQTHPAGLFVWGELKSKLDYMERSYMSGMKSTLTELFDCPPEYSRTLKTGAFTIKRPCPSVIAASTTAWLNGSISKGDMQGGFLQRFIYVPAFKKDRNLAWPTPVDQYQKNQLVIQLRRASQLVFEADTSKIREPYEDWHKKNSKEIEEMEESSGLHSFFARLETVCLKLAMVYEASVRLTPTAAMLDGFTISEESLQFAINLVEYLKNTARWMVGEELVFSEEMGDARDLLKIIEASPGIDRRHLMRNSHLNAKRFREAIDTLLQSGMVVMKIEKPKQGSDITQFFITKQ